MRSWLVVYVDSNSKYSAAAWATHDSALEHGGFDRAVVTTWSNISAHWKKKNHELLSIKKGHGHFVWKPYVLYSAMLGTARGDLVCYIDTDMRFVSNFTKTLTRVGVDIANPASDVLLFHNKPAEPIFDAACFTKRLAQNVIGCSFGRCTKSSGTHGYWTPGARKDVWAGLVCARNTAYARWFVLQWLYYSEDLRVIRQDADNGSELLSHQEDQAVLSTLACRWNVTSYDLPPSSVGGAIYNVECPTCSSCHTRSTKPYCGRRRATPRQI